MDTNDFKFVTTVPKSNAQLFLGYLGFWGFTGFAYFYSYHSAFLLLFSLFGLFGWFFLQKIHYNKHDEVYEKNKLLAKSNALVCAVTLVCFIVISTIFLNFPSVVYVLICALGIASVFLTYCISFYLYEKKF